MGCWAAVFFCLLRRRPRLRRLEDAFLGALAEAGALVSLALAFDRDLDEDRGRRRRRRDFLLSSLMMARDQMITT